MDFESRLKKAIQRGHRRGDESVRAAEAQAMSEDELKRLHSQYRLQLSEHIEACIGRVPHHFPGFEYETIYGERGWGAACRRDDLRLRGRGRRENLYTRLEITVRPYSTMNVLDLMAKGTIHNKEIFTRQHYEAISDVDPARFLELIDAWVLEFAELYATKL